jgi:drug/metabolite transporter (DMT)-like permease
MAVRPKNASAPASKAGGWRSLIASILIILLICAIWTFLGTALRTRSLHVAPGNAALFGQLAVAFALFIIGGLLGVVNGIGQIRTGRRSKPLTVAMLLVMLVAFGTVVYGVSTGSP